MEKNEIFMELRGSNCVDCQIIIQGKEDTLGAALCGKFYAELLQGKAFLGFENGMIIFAAENISCKFPIEETKKESVKKLIEYGRFRLEPIMDGFNSGFSLSRDF